ncbi:hypothetical protein IQ273_06975 [Nodosilinea sp. LEGE 07298]|uniref:hypothetical protein n=1 Tax=Nodosilinea sp. LEGE 07298 TaxID=2777970 RepID=UPI001880E3B9|nr:hypothetical protein [Nodosilinea sp. LEGE 07298]MBE9109163.1 hypothetical protein [Nodosilinea sp. LEGE 07298]
MVDPILAVAAPRSWGLRPRGWRSARCPEAGVTVVLRSPALARYQGDRRHCCSPETLGKRWPDWRRECPAQVLSDLRAFSVGLCAPLGILALP